MGLDISFHKTKTHYDRLTKIECPSNETYELEDVIDGKFIYELRNTYDLLMYFCRIMKVKDLNDSIINLTKNDVVGIKKEYVKSTLDVREYDKFIS